MLGLVCLPGYQRKGCKIHHQTCMRLRYKTPGMYVNHGGKKFTQCSFRLGLWHAFYICPPSNYTFGRDKGQTIRGICYPTPIDTGCGHLDSEDQVIPSHFVTPNTGFVIYGPQVITSPLPSLNPPNKQALITVFKKLVRLTALRHL